MKIRTIRVEAARSMPIKGVMFNNTKPGIAITADIEEGEDALVKARELHQQVESLLEDQCDELIAFIRFRQGQRDKAAAQAALKASDDKAIAKAKA